MTTALATASTTLTIEIIRINKIPKLFAPAVQHGAEVLFLNNLGIEYTVTFENGSPFKDISQFTVAQDAEVPMTVMESVANQTYHFQIATSVSAPVHLWLTVETDGVDRVGFVAGPAMIPTGIDIRTLLWAPAGELELQFDNEIDTTANIRISDYPDDPIQVTPQQPDATVTVPFFERTTIQLIYGDGTIVFDESGGTETVDILVEDP